MEQIDVFLYPLLPVLIILHLLAAPYTKVEESFNIQAIHDISTYGIPLQNISSTLQQSYDHFEFPGAVPRTFVGALAVAGISKPIISFFGTQHAQFIVRAVLGLFNGVALMKYRSALVNAFGRDVGRWYVLLQASQFHVIFYASRTLPNMFAFGLTTLAMRQFLPTARPLKKSQIEKKHTTAIFLFVFSGVVFRSELALLLASQLLYLLIQSRISIPTILKVGFGSALISLAISVPIDSYFWQKPIWPELAGFYFNAIQGKSADWGTSPMHSYLTSILPRLLLNPLILLFLIPLAAVLPATKSHARNLLLPGFLFITIYSLQPHKESRFIIYVVPPFTAAASLSASYIWTRKSKSTLYLLASILLLGSIAASFAGASAMLLISSLNYPGGAAISQLHRIINRTPWTAPITGKETIKVHMDVLSCMTGVTRFQELSWRNITPSSRPLINGRPTQLIYDKTEDSPDLLKPAFWHQFDYLLMEDPTKAIGSWEVVDSIHAYAGIEILRPGDGSSFSEKLERAYAANNITKGDDGGAPSSEDVKEAVEEGKVDIDPQFKHDEQNRKAKLLMAELGGYGSYKLVRDACRQVTGGWWVGPRMEPRIRIMKRLK